MPILVLFASLTGYAYNSGNKGMNHECMTGTHKGCGKSLEEATRRPSRGGHHVHSAYGSLFRFPVSYE